MLFTKGAKNVSQKLFTKGSKTLYKPFTKTFLQSFSQNPLQNLNK